MTIELSIEEQDFENKVINAYWTRELYAIAMNSMPNAKKELQEPSNAWLEELEKQVKEMEESVNSHAFDKDRRAPRLTNANFAEMSRFIAFIGKV